MKQFEIPAFYRSPIISKVKAKRKLVDPRKKDFSPSVLSFGTLSLIFARHFGFCYGVENAIEISYRAIEENPGKRIFLLSQMIHNPEVNEDLLSHGLKFIQDTNGVQLIDWSDIRPEDIVIIPAFGTTIEIEEKLESIGVDVKRYNTTCPFVEKVWNRAEKLGNDGHTIIIHGKYKHEETRATFSHSDKNAPSLIIKDLDEARYLGDYILGKHTRNELLEFFDEKYSKNFNPERDLFKIGVVNQTTMLATETQEITEYLRSVMETRYGKDEIRNHIADTRDTLCYATNDNQTATYGLLETNADLAIVIGGRNSSNTTHLVELLEQKFPVLFIRSEKDIDELGIFSTFNIHTGSEERSNPFEERKANYNVIITSGASCPDAVVDRVLRKIIELFDLSSLIEPVIDKFLMEEKN
jgi:4-hydroxy-3-methylbut-2-enyl diphosphate reductase